MMTKEKTISLSLRVSLMVWMIIVSACSQPPTRPQVGSIDDVVAHVPDPAMKKVWLDAEAKHALPPTNKIPVVDNPVSHRQIAQVKAVPTKPTRPVIPQEAVIAVQPFSETALTRYDGPFDIVAHEPGVLKAKLRDQESPFEIFYKLPGPKKALQAQKSASLHLTYRDEVLGNTLQRRIILLDSETKRTPLIAIAEGSPKPYQTVIETFGLVIEQATKGEHPAVTVRYGDQVIILQEGETKVIGEGEQQLTAYLLNSYVQDRRFAEADAGQPYYVNIVLYQ